MAKNKFFYKKISAAFCLFLALLMGLAMPLQVYAESTDITYLSDIKLYYSSNSSEAKTGLEKEGYTFLNNNLNAGTDKDKGVYLGYKTTTNPDMAITDIRMLGMESGFQLYDYKQMVEYLKHEQSGTALTMLEAANEFSQNYGANNPKAISAYKGLNLYYVDEANMKLGDYLVAGKADLDFFMKMIFKSSAATLNAVIGFLNAAVTPYENAIDEETGETVSLNWAQELPTSSVYDVLNGNPTVDEIKNMKKQYNDNAVATFHQIQVFIMKYENALARNPKGVKTDTSLNTPEKVIEKTEEVEEEDADLVYIEGFNKLCEYQYTDDMTIGEWFLDIGHKTTDEMDITELYPLIDVMSNAQNDLVGDTGLLSAISNLGKNERITKFEETLPQIKQEIKEYNNKETLSIWANADDDFENSTIAFTSEAIRKQNANNLLIRSDEPDLFAEQFELVMKWISIALGILTVVVFIAAKVMTAVVLAASSVTLVSTLCTMLTVIGYVGAVCMWAGVIAAVVTLVTMLILWINSLTEDEDEPVEKLRMPSYVIDAPTSGSGESLTVRYKTVTANGVNLSIPDVEFLKKSPNDPELYLGDLNAFQEKRWNTICYTRDMRVGSPIRMDDDNNIFKVVQGDAKTPDGYAPLRPFGERNAGNCNSYCKQDSVGGIYLFYRTERSIKNESPESDENTPDSKISKNGYIATLYVATAETEAKAKAKITRQTTKYYVFDRNLSPSAGYATYVGYTLTMDPKQAITDIRVAPYNGNNSVNYGDAQYIFAGTVGVNMSDGESNASSRNDALLYTTDECAGSPIIADAFHVTSSPNEAKPGWEAVTPFSNGLPYDFNVTHVSEYNVQDASGYFIPVTPSGGDSNITGYWSKHKDIYLYFEPSEQYKDGEKYLSGMFFLSGYNANYLGYTGENAYTKDEVKSEFSALTNKYKQYNIVSVVDVNLSQSVTDDTTIGCKYIKTYIGYTYTYNPKRAVYDLALFQGTPYSASLPYSVSKRQEDNSIINYVASTTYVQQGWDGMKLYRAISNQNSFMNCQSNILDGPQATYVCYKTEFIYETGDDIQYGLTKKAIPTVGLYATGPAKSKEPLRMCDIVISQNKYTPSVNEDDIEIRFDGENALDGKRAEGVFHSITNIANPSSTTVFNFGYATKYYCSEDKVKKMKDGVNLFVYQRGPARTKAKYISSLSLGAYSKELYQSSINSSSDENVLKGIDYIADMNAMAGAASTCVDEVLIRNLALKPNGAWYNRKGDYARQSRKPVENNSAAYIGITRTNNPKDAITGALLVQNNNRTADKTIKIGRVVYYCDSIQTPMFVNGKRYYLYYTRNTGVNAGQPIEELSVDDMPLSKGSATAVCAKDNEDKTEKVYFTDKDMPAFLHMAYDHGNMKGAFFNKLYVGTGETQKEAMLELVSNECVEFMDLDLNDGAPGNSVYIGFRFGVLDQTAINKKKTEEAKEEERRAQQQEAICDILVTEGEPYQPDGFISKNHVYYKPVAEKNLNDGNLGDELYMYYTSDYVSDAFNRKNNASTYRAMDVFSPIKSLAMARYDCVPYNTEYAQKSNESELMVYEYVMHSDEKMPIDLNAGIIETDDDFDAEGDNRITMFVSRFDNSMKSSAEITGGYVGEYTKTGDLILKGQG